MKCFKDIHYMDGAHDRDLLDIYVPENPVKPTPVVIWFHGGGLEKGSKDGGIRLAEAHDRYGIATVSASYRLYPNAKYPEFIEDAAAAVAYTMNHIREYLDNPGGFFVSGASAGAYLSMMLCFDRSYLGKYGFDPDTDIAGWIHGSAQPTDHFNVLRERGYDTKRVMVTEAAPLYHIDRSTFSPMMILTSNADIANRMNQNILVRSTMQHFGAVNEIDLRILSGRHCAFLKPREDGTVEQVEISKDFIMKYNRPYER